MIEWRTGNGFDVHRFTHGDEVVLGGIRIQHDYGIDAHSDGDVLIHALCDALLGAGALGDIGLHFPPGKAQTLNLDSRVMLRRCVTLLKDQKLSVWHVDATVVCERPKLRPHVDAIRAVLSDDLEIPAARVSVKATTTERLGFTGRSEGIAVQATATVCGDTR